MKNKVMLIFLIACVLQISVPIYMIKNRETVIRNGNRYLLKVAPIDPYDAFRGRYVSIRLQENSYESSENLGIEDGARVYLWLGKGVEHDVISEISTRKPKESDFIRGRITYIEKTGDRYIYHFRSDLRRYYLQEDKARKAEAEFRDKGGMDSYIEIAVKDGEAVCVGLKIGDQFY